VPGTGARGGDLGTLHVAGSLTFLYEDTVRTPWFWVIQGP